MIKLHNIHLAYGEKEILRGITLDVRQGEVITLIGPSGSGKTTLLRSINALSLPYKGMVTIDDTTITFDDKPHNKELSKLRQHTGMVFQAFHLFPHLTVLKNVMEGPITVKKQAKETAEPKALKLLEQVGLLDKKDAYPPMLSGGQQQRIAIARALAMDPKVMLFDEPTSALDIELIGDVLEVIRKLSTKGMTMLIVTHQIGFATEIADRMLFMDEGRIIEEGPPQALLDSPKTERLQQFLGKIKLH